MWKALRIFKQYATPQPLRIFSTNSCCYSNECEEEECDTFGTLDISGVKKLESIVKAAADKYPVRGFNEFVKDVTPKHPNKKSFNEFIEGHNSIYPVKAGFKKFVKDYNAVHPTGNVSNEFVDHKSISSVRRGFNKFVQEHKHNDESNYKYTTTSHFQNLHSFDENVNTSSENICDIVDEGNKKYLLAKFNKKKARNSIASTNETYHAIDPDGSLVELPRDDKDFRVEILDCLTPYQYHKKIERLINENNINAAIAVFEKEMPERNARPDVQIYGIVIGIYAHMGYTLKAFKVYNEVKTANMFVQRRVITSLFNACANSPWPKEDGLPRAIKLRKHLIDTGYPFNNSQYCAMIKAFGRCGDIETSFDIVDEMVHQGFVITIENINHLLCACVDDKQSGFRHALLLWKRMRHLKLHADIYSYNLLLRIIRDCKAGDQDLFADLVNCTEETRTIIPKKAMHFGNDNFSMHVGQTNNSSSMHAGQTNNSSSMHAGKSGNNNSNRNDILEVTNKQEMHITVMPADNSSSSVTTEQRFNLWFGSEMRSTEIVGITSLPHCQDRFALVGGLRNVLSSMHRDRVKPTVTTFSKLLHLVPNTEEHEMKLLQLMEKFEVKPTLFIINELIFKRVLDKRYKSALKTVELIPKYALVPDKKTFRYLASTCETTSSVDTFFQDIETSGIRLDRTMLFYIIEACIRNSNFVAVLDVLNRCDRRQLSVNKYIITALETARKNIRNEILLNERKNPGITYKISDEKRKFLMEYNLWLNKTRMHKQRHPWARYGYEGAYRPHAVKDSTSDSL